MSESWDEKRRALREQAEKLLSTGIPESQLNSHAEMERIVHDLSVHQIELELQNEELQHTQQQMEAARDNYARLYHSAPVGYLSLDANGIILQTNQTFVEMLGLTTPKIIGKTLASFIAQEDRQVFLGRFRAFFHNPQGKSLDVRLIQREGKTSRTLFTRLTGRLETVERLVEPANQQTSLLVIISDISSQKVMEDALRESEELFRLAFENANVGMCLVDIQGRFLKVNERMCEIFGYSQEEFEKLTVASITHPDYLEITQKLFTRSAKGETDHFSYEKQYLHKTGHVLWGQVSSSLVRNKDGRPRYFISHVQDITERKITESTLRQTKEELEQKNQELKWAFAREQLLARTDALTGVNNRRYFFEVAVHEFSAAARYGHPLTAIMFDIDHFKTLNDTYGHQNGDEMLRLVAQTAKKQLRSADIIARYGGEEFIILLPHTNVKQAYAVAERIRQFIMTLRLESDRSNAGVTVSLGVAGRDPENDSLDRLIQRADQTMYAAKNCSRNLTLVFGEEQNEQNQ